MRATQKFIDEQFIGLIEKIEVLNPDLVMEIRKKDPEMQYSILRLIDKFDEKLFYVAISSATEKWLDHLVNYIECFEIFPSLKNDLYRVAGVTPEEVEKAFTERVDPEKLHEEIITEKPTAVDNIKDWWSNRVTDKTKNGLKYAAKFTFMSIPALLVGILIGQASD
ncbi:MAG: hypothetical protein IJN87_09770 [Firmicutes bacterium]|nr:hypothetical protein [Bacillota bacterium]